MYRVSIAEPEVYTYTKKDPSKAYITNNLLLPKQYLNVQVVKQALTFQLNDEEPVFETFVDEESGETFDQEIGVRAKTMRLWDETAYHLIVPRDFISENQYSEFGCEFVRVPEPSFLKVRIEDKIQLRDEDQPEAFQSLLDNQSGTLNLSCGKGKTIIALKATAAFKVPTLIVVNTTALLEQWKEEIQRHLGVDSVGIIQGKNRDWQGHPIVLAMVHSLSFNKESWPREFREYFGLVLYDEGHHMSAPVFARSADLFYGKRFSLTATAARTDGLEVIYQYHLGPVIHKNLSQDLIPTTYFHRMKWELPFGHKWLVMGSDNRVNMSRVRTYLGRIEWRNNLIYQQISVDLQEGRQILVLSHSVDHVEALAAYFSAYGGGMITGKTPQEDRMGILRGCNPVFGTFQLAREGLNKPPLDTLHIVTAFSNENDQQQSWGRIQRWYQDKLDPIVRVWEDMVPDLETIHKSCNRLRTVLRKINYPYDRVDMEIP